MKKIYKDLTEEQKKRNVVFSSCLSLYTTEQKTDRLHEVLKDEEDKSDKINKLCDDKFFNKSPFYRYNIVRR